MSRPLKWHWKESITVFLTALLLAVGMALTFYRALLPQQAVLPVLLLCALFTLIFQGLFAVRFRGKAVFCLLLIIAPVLWVLLGGGPLYPVVQGVKAAFLSFSGVTEAAAPYAGELRWAICLLFSLLSAALVWDRTLPLALFSTGAVLALSFAIGGRASLLLCALPAAAGLLMLLAGEEGKRPLVLLIAGVLAGGAFLLLPPSPATARPLKDTANAIRQFVEDYLLFNEYRSSFSLASEGYQPLEERLGGPAQPTDRQVMAVKTDRALLLRGRTYDDYSGLNWFDTLSSRRYLYASPQHTALRDSLFDLSRPLAGEAIPALTVSVRMLGDSPTTLFAPCRTLTLTPESQRMVLYYNMAAERFITRDLAPGDSYSFSYLPYAPGLPETRRAVETNASADDPYYDLMAQRYLSVPRHIQQEVYEIASRATQGAETPYDKALGIQRYLQTHYTYDLNVQTPPEGVDFAAWFLIGEKQGYCTYFATAMTLLCRISGIPARYVTGYLVTPEAGGETVVTGRSAHAWTEIYLNGFGWLDFDATPRGDNRPGSDSGENPPEESPSPTPAPTMEPEAAPSPSPTPSPAPEDEHENGGAPSPTPSPTPEPEAEDAPSPTPSDAPEPPPNGQPPFPWWVLILLLIAALIARFLLTEPLRRAKRQPRQAAAILFAAIAALLASRGLRRQPQETLHEFAARADEALTRQALPPVSDLTEAYAAQLYGNHPADSAPFAAAYRQHRDRASRWTRLGLALKRMLGLPWKKKGDA